MEREALERYLENLHPACFGWALACCGADRDEAEEVLQASYLKAIEGKARYNGHASLRTWFFGVVRRTALEHQRLRINGRKALFRLFTSQPSTKPSPTPESLSGEDEAQVRLRRALSELSERQQDLLHLVFYQDMTIEQAAEVLEITVGTARTHYGRGKSRLREKLTDLGDYS